MLRLYCLAKNPLNPIKIGRVYLVDYFLILNNKKRKIFKFIGLCVSLNKRTGAFRLENILNGEDISILFNYNSPSIYKVEQLDNYFYPSRCAVLKKKSRTVFKDSRKIKNKNPTDFDFNIFQSLVDPLFPDKKKIRYLKSKFRF